MTFLHGHLDLPFATFQVLNPAFLSPPASPAAAAAAIRAPVSSACSSSSPPPTATVSTVAQALDFARDNPKGADNPTVSATLEAALAVIWRRIQARPRSYVMTREEFAVFNYFQHRFQGDRLAIAARKRYWDHFHAFGNE
jgi:hypothetical protein